MKRNFSLLASFVFLVCVFPLWNKRHLQKTCLRQQLRKQIRRSIRRLIPRLKVSAATSRYFLKATATATVKFIK